MNVLILMLILSFLYPYFSLFFYFVIQKIKQHQPTSNLKLYCHPITAMLVWTHTSVQAGVFLLYIGDGQYATVGGGFSGKVLWFFDPCDGGRGLAVVFAIEPGNPSFVNSHGCRSDLQMDWVYLITWWIVSTDGLCQEH